MGTSFSIVDECSKQRKRIFKKRNKKFQSVRPNNFITPPKQSGLFRMPIYKEDSIFKIPLAKSRKRIYQDKILNQSTDCKNTNVMYSFNDRKYFISQTNDPIPFLGNGNEVELVYEQINQMYVHNKRGLSRRHKSTKMVNRLLRGGENNLIFEPPFKGADTKSMSYDSEDSCISYTFDGELDSIHENIHNGIKIDSESGSSNCDSHDTGCGSC